METLKIKVNKSDKTGIFHDSRRDVEELGRALNIIIKKINEIIDEINKK